MRLPSSRSMTRAYWYSVSASWMTRPESVWALRLPTGTLKADSDSGRTIFETDTEYQYARVVERGDGSRILELNEGQAQHSLWRPGTVLTGGYWDGMLVAPFAGGSGEAPRRVAILGNAAGTTARAYAELFPGTHVDGVEIDAELSEIGKRYFGLREGPRLALHHEDARPFLRQADARYDVIAIDAYRQPYIPFYLSTREFFELCRDRRREHLLELGLPLGVADVDHDRAAWRQPVAA